MVSLLAHPGEREKAEPKTAALMALARAVVGNDAIDDPRWESLSLIISVTDQGRNIGNTGFAYSKGTDWWPIAVPPKTIQEASNSLIQAALNTLPKGLVRILIQCNRRTGETHARVERCSAVRWMIDPDNATEMMRTLRPDFDDDEQS